MTEKPPLGLTPKFIHRDRRVREIVEAMFRYTTDGLDFPAEWAEELLELLEQRAVEEKSHSIIGT